ncbi:hypothetical protein BLOT_009412 [Blomia tropicalis]|nr:hypothetical protein BLOT_009412 [Blomia tropicalis]
MPLISRPNLKEGQFVGQSPTNLVSMDKQFLGNPPKVYQKIVQYDEAANQLNKPISNKTNKESSQNLYSLKSRLTNENSKSEFEQIISDVDSSISDKSQKK